MEGVQGDGEMMMIPSHPFHFLQFFDLEEREGSLFKYERVLVRWRRI